MKSILFHHVVDFMRNKLYFAEISRLEYLALFTKYESDTNTVM